MSNFTECLRDALNLTGCTYKKAAEEAGLLRQALTRAFHGRTRLRRNNAHALVQVAVDKIGAGIKMRPDDAEVLERARLALIDAFNDEYDRPKGDVAGDVRREPASVAECDH